MATAETNPVVAIAAEQLEFAGLVRRGRNLKKLPWPVDYAVSLQINGRPWVLVANGPGPRLASEAVRAALSTVQPRAVLSTGLCGGLAHTLKRGDIYVGEEVFDHAGQRRFASQSPRFESPATTGRVLSMDRVAVTVRHKRELLALGCSVVEMEASAVALAAQDRNLPFYCIRAVSDTASESLPFDFNRFRDRSGRFNRGRIAAEALIRPTALPRLLELGRAARAASESLGEFLVQCQF
jgi:adenosylhomocysteine nucleosidase